jgi:hypothetical protein
MTAPDGTKWLVALVDSCFTKGNNSKSSHVITLKDPSTDQSHQYVFANGKDIVEFQSLEADFSSFIVGRHVVKDGNLYVLNRVDPLFFALSQYGPSQEYKQWQPFEQVVESLPQEVRKALEEKQMGHICLALSSEQSGDVPFYKFKADRALKWLRKKHDSVFQCLLQQNQAKIRREKEKLSKNGRSGGSVSASFNMPDTDPMAATPASGDVLITDTGTLKIEATQIISSYLTEEWSKRFIESIGMKKDVVTASNSVKKAKMTHYTTKHVQVEESPKQKKVKKVVEQARTVGNKRLAKVNTKGMKSLSSFFGAPKKKTKIQ